MRELPILFGGPMVRAIRAGRKTQTRRVIRDCDAHEVKWHEGMPGQPSIAPAGRALNGYAGWQYRYRSSPVFLPLKCPYGDPCDQLWVRETFAQTMGGLYYAADFDPANKPVCAWRPSIFMPRRHSRITLEVVAVSVERLHEMNHEKARIEGFSDFVEFKMLWEKLNKARGYGWDVNPWVWVVTFKRLDPEARR